MRNVLAAQAAGREVAGAGAMPVVPHSIGLPYHGELDDPFWLAGTLELLRRCDGLYCFNTRHLDTSAGTRSEVEEAGRLGLPVFFNFDHLAAWLAGKVAA